MAQILILTPQLPYPPQQGTTLRNFNLIAGLARLGHTLDLAAFEPARPESQATGVGLGSDVGSPLTRYCRSITTVPAPTRTLARRARDTLLQSLPDMALRLESLDMHRRVADLLAARRYDVVQVEGIEMAPYAPVGRTQQGPDRPALVVFDDHNAEYVLQQRAFLTDVHRPRRWLAAGYSVVQWQKLVHYERRTCRAADRVVAVSETDCAALQRLAPGLEVTVVPNGVDLDLYRPGATPPLTDLAAPALVFTGKMDYRPNIDAVLWFADEVLPLIRAGAPAAHFYVVGQQPHARLARLAGQPGVTLTGRVPDVRPYMAGASVYVVPLRIGGGTRLKVLEAMAMGLPIVSTRLGCDGFPFQDAAEVRFADDPPAFATAVLDLLADREQAARLGRAARAYVAAHYGWDAIVPRLARVYPR
ncbi:MAG TPA: glycosyltransferase [Anaerolineae bacterium]